MIPLRAIINDGPRSRILKKPMLKSEYFPLHPEYNIKSLAREGRGESFERRYFFQRLERDSKIIARTRHDTIRYDTRIDNAARDSTLPTSL